MSYRQNFDLGRSHERAIGEVVRELEAIGQDIIKHAADYLDEQKINVDGDLKKSLTAQVDRFVSGVLLKAGAGAQHAPFVHYGTRPHWPPSEPIRQWVRKKLNITERGEVRRVAYLVARKIAQRGTEAKPFFDFAIARVENTFARRILDAYGRGFARAA